MAISQSLSRTLRSLTTAPWQHRWLNDDAMHALENALTEAERGHGGEIRLLIERSLPLSLAWQQDVRARAEDFFAHLRVWDTVARSGVLVYVNLAERRLEIVADRGISAVVPEARWQALCNDTLPAMRDGQYVHALGELLKNIGAEMRAHYGAPDDPHGDELPNRIEWR
ncbi:MAG: TPM domain-containing protein [Cardiobacteriaceae bacterium]|nr:TPM domain-containing protein [Cardiobacteriaceae bacterium]